MNCEKKKPIAVSHAVSIDEFWGREFWRKGGPITKEREVTNGSNRKYRISRKRYCRGGYHFEQPKAAERNPSLRTMALYGAAESRPSHSSKSRERKSDLQVKGAEHWGEGGKNNFEKKGRANNKVRNPQEAVSHQRGGGSLRMPKSSSLRKAG